MKTVITALLMGFATTAFAAEPAKAPAAPAKAEAKKDEKKAEAKK